MNFRLIKQYVYTFSEMKNSRLLVTVAHFKCRDSITIVNLEMDKTVYVIHIYD